MPLMPQDTFEYGVQRHHYHKNSRHDDVNDDEDDDDDDDGDDDNDGDEGPD